MKGGRKRRETERSRTRKKDIMVFCNTLFMCWALKQPQVLRTLWSRIHWHSFFFSTQHLCVAAFVIKSLIHIFNGSGPLSWVKGLHIQGRKRNIFSPKLPWNYLKSKSSPKRRGGHDENKPYSKIQNLPIWVDTEP